jgi:polysaccharide biosynthesis/export protein
MKAKILLLVVSTFSLGMTQQTPVGGVAGVSNTTVLGPGDEVVVDVVELPESFHAKQYRVESDGSLDLPLIGSVPAAGRTVAQLKADIDRRLRTQVLNPHVMVSVATTKSRAVSVMGAVNTPGAQQIEGRRTLFDVVAGAGGLKEDAGDVITVTRQQAEGPLNLPGASVNAATGSSVAEVRVSDLVQQKDPMVNIEMRPHDEVSVPRARLLYVIGDVKKAGGFTLSEKRSLSALEALSLAEGLGPNAAPKSARILRRTAASDTARQQIPVNLKRILAGKDEDIRLQPDDILFVPDNSGRRITAKVAETALATISGIAIWRGF